MACTCLGPVSSEELVVARPTLQRLDASSHLGPRRSELPDQLTFERVQSAFGEQWRLVEHCPQAVKLERGKDGVWMLSRVPCKGPATLLNPLFKLSLIHI